MEYERLFSDKEDIVVIETIYGRPDLQIGSCVNLDDTT
jgi:hypothetical protein